MEGYLSSVLAKLVYSLPGDTRRNRLVMGVRPATWVRLAARLRLAVGGQAGGRGQAGRGVKLAAGIRPGNGGRGTKHIHFLKN
jgi:hypothetical protein